MGCEHTDALTLAHTHRHTACTRGFNKGPEFPFALRGNPARKGRECECECECECPAPGRSPAPGLGLTKAARGCGLRVTPCSPEQRPAARWYRRRSACPRPDCAPAPRGGSRGRQGPEGGNHRLIKNHYPATERGGGAGWRGGGGCPALLITTPTPSSRFVVPQTRSFSGLRVLFNVKTRRGHPGAAAPPGSAAELRAHTTHTLTHTHTHKSP